LPSERTSSVAKEYDNFTFNQIYIKYY
jgi:hypothetical protein